MRGSEPSDILEDRDRRAVFPHLFEDPHEVPKCSRLLAVKSTSITSEGKVGTGGGCPGDCGVRRQIAASDVSDIADMVVGVCSVLRAI